MYRVTSHFPFFIKIKKKSVSKFNLTNLCTRSVQILWWFSREKYYLEYILMSVIHIKSWRWYRIDRPVLQKCNVVKNTCPIRARNQGGVASRRGADVTRICTAARKRPLHRHVHSPISRRRQRAQKREGCRRAGRCATPSFLPDVSPTTMVNRSRVTERSYLIGPLVHHHPSPSAKHASVADHVTRVAQRRFCGELAQRGSARLGATSRNNAWFIRSAVIYRRRRLAAPRAASRASDGIVFARR